MKSILPNSQRGQSLVEFAISLTVIMILLAGAVEFGIALFQYVQLRDAAQEGALYGSLNPDDSTGIIQHVEAASSSPLDLTSAAVTITPTCLGTDGSTIACSSACEGDGIQVEVSFQHPIAMPFVGGFIGSETIPLRAHVTDTILFPECSSPSPSP